MQWYESLNDAVEQTGISELMEGDTEIWYGRMGQIVTSQTLSYAASLGWMPDRNNLAHTHVHIGNIQEDGLEEVFALMQGECWSPQGQANMMLRELGADHTSMSVGDVVKIGDFIWICRPSGWEEVP